MSLGFNDDQINAIKAAVCGDSPCYILDIKPATLKGEGYMGSLSCVSLQRGKDRLELIVKRAESTDNEEHKTFTRKAYLREIYIYNNVLREFEMFQRENSVVNGFTGYARIYGSSDKENNEHLILENLKKSGYELWNRKIPMDAEHVALVFSEYGKFHAVSLAMKEMKPNLYTDLTRDLDDYYGSSMSGEESKEMIRSILQVGFKAVEGCDTTAASYKRFADIAEKFLLEDLQTSEDSLVITHADCWCNNMLFKYEDMRGIKKPKNVCFIDWQLSKVGPPILDLAYFFFVCTAGDILHDYGTYLKIYYSAVTEVLVQFSCDPEKLFPYALLEYLWKEYAKLGLYMALMTLNFMLCESDVPNWSESIKTGEFGCEETEFENSTTNEFNEKIRDIVNVMVEHDLI